MIERAYKKQKRNKRKRKKQKETPLKRTTGYKRKKQTADDKLFEKKKGK